MNITLNALIVATNFGRAERRDALIMSGETRSCW
jgi:hypothetical protein